MENETLEPKKVPPAPTTIFEGLVNFVKNNLPGVAIVVLANVIIIQDVRMVQLNKEKDHLLKEKDELRQNDITEKRETIKELQKSKYETLEILREFENSRLR